MPHARPAGIRRDRPHYFPTPATPVSRAPNGIRHARYPDHRLDVVDADDVGSPGDAQRDRRGRPFQPLTGGQVERLADERLPRGADQQRESQPAEFGKAPDDLETLFARFAESDARV